MTAAIAVARDQVWIGIFNGVPQSGGPTDRVSVQHPDGAEIGFAGANQL
jgi:hypothetical protein